MLAFRYFAIFFHYFTAPYRLLNYYNYFYSNFTSRMTIQDYIDKLNTRFKTGISTEHSYRGDLQNLVETLVTDILVTNEPSRVACGAPDYILTKKNIPVGYIEAKDIGADLDNKLYKEQFDRYNAALHNLIITNYLDFRLYRDGVFVTSISIA